jgi:predicted ATP-grasp superfamily ATP-dependent carboligase
MIKTVLIVALNTNWPGISRLPFGLTRAGFEVFALCPKISYLAKTQFLKSSFLYPTFTYSRSKLIYLWMIISILIFKPNLVIPGDEDAVLALHNLANAFSKIPFFNRISKLIRNSLTPQAYDSLVLSKSEFQNKCLEWGLPTPKNIVVANLAEAISAASDLGYPVVLKNESGYGGTGVFICENEADVKKNFNQQETKPGIQSIKNLLKKIFFISVFREVNQISIQQYIDGQVGLIPFSSKNGEVFASNTLLKHKTHPGKTGPTSVAIAISNPEIEQAVIEVAKQLNYTGFGSLDFIVEKKSGKAFIIELNPRPTPMCHIDNKVLANDLCEMFYLGLNSFPRKKREFKPSTIALFPNEKRRDPTSIYLTEAFHDIPINDPHLLKALDS